jgi:hypothetical protein
MQRPRGNDQDEGELTSIAPEEWAEAEPQRSNYFGRLRPGAPSLHASPHANDRPSMTRRLSRSLIRFLIAVLIGVGATLGWQSHGDEAKEMVRNWVPELDWLLSTTNSSSDGRMPAHDAALSQSPPFTQTPAPVAAATSSELAQQLEPIARNLAVVLSNLKELTANQEQMAQQLSTLQAVEQDVRQKTLSPPPPQRAPTPRPKPTKPAAQSSTATPPSLARSPSPARQPLPLQ